MATETTTQIERLVESLDAYIAGDQSLAEIESVFKTAGDFENFWHYLADADIRACDKEHNEMQGGELKKFVSALKRSDFRTARKITFLSDTD
ncbi:MAG: hypothetical protein ACI915_000268 [Gammaproteobacteria bacterium]|jgi:hypothetical protein